MGAQVHIELKPSRIYLVSLGICTPLLILLLYGLPIAIGWQALGSLVVVACSGWLMWRDVLLQSACSCLSLMCNQNREISFGMRNGEHETGRVCADTLVTPWLVLLNLEVAGRCRRSVLLFRDAMPAEDFRRLRVVLRNSAELQS